MSPFLGELGVCRLALERGANLVGAWSSALQRLLQVLHIFRHALGRQQGFIRIDERFEQRGSRCREQRIETGGEIGIGGRCESP